MDSMRREVNFPPGLAREATRAAKSTRSRHAKFPALKPRLRPAMTK